LVATYPAEADPVQPFETEDEMVAFMEDVGGPVYVG
jgi:hypothetical protein